MNAFLFSSLTNNVGLILQNLLNSQTQSWTKMLQNQISLNLNHPDSDEQSQNLSNAVMHTKTVILLENVQVRKAFLTFFILKVNFLLHLWYIYIGYIWGNEGKLHVVQFLSRKVFSYLSYYVIQALPPDIFSKTFPN